jgi:coiled-coil domain-containing protein 12
MSNQIRFKNYQPSSEELKTNAKDSLTEIRQEIAQVEENTERLAQEAISNVPDLKDNMDLTHIAPQKPNWDLKRELETKMASLERKTIKILSEMTRNGHFFYY